MNDFLSFCLIGTAVFCLFGDQQADAFSMLSKQQPQSFLLSQPITSNSRNIGLKMVDEEKDIEDVITEQEGSVLQSPDVEV